MLTLGCLLERLQEMTEEELKQNVTIHDGRRDVGMIYATSTEMKGPGNQFTLQIAFPERIQ